jgi:hypothetical protein
MLINDRKEAFDTLKTHLDQELAKGKQTVQIGEYGYVSYWDDRHKWAWGYYCGTIPGGNHFYETAHDALWDLIRYINIGCIL